MKKTTARPRVRWCCQGAEECDGLRYNGADACFEFILYLNDGEPVWYPAVACPICGEPLPPKANS